jgi:hypothetical protein
MGAASIHEVRQAVGRRRTGGSDRGSRARGDRGLGPRFGDRDDARFATALAQLEPSARSGHVGETAWREHSRLRAGQGSSSVAAEAVRSESEGRPGTFGTVGLCNAIRLIIHALNWRRPAPTG